MGQPCNFFNTNDTLRRCHVRQGLALGYVADGVVTFHVGFIKIIGRNQPALYFNAYFFEADVFDVGRYARRRKHYVGLKRLFTVGGFHKHLHALAAGINSQNFGIGKNFNAHFFVLLGKFL